MSPEDRELRRKTLGSSEISAVCGVNPYQTMHDVWLSKCRNVDFEGNEATELGNLLEPSIAAIYSDRYGAVLHKGKYTIGRLPWMSATPDYHIDGGGLLEAKLVGFRSVYQWGPGDTDERQSDIVPMSYLVQCQWQMRVTGEPFVKVAALMGTEFRTYTIHSDGEIQGRLEAKGMDFWERYVLTGTPPPVDGSRNASDMLKVLYPRSGPEPIRGDAACEEMVSMLRSARDGYTKAETEKRLRENKIKEYLGDASGAYGEGWRIRYRTTASGSRPFVFEEKE